MVRATDVMSKSLEYVAVVRGFVFLNLGRGPIILKPGGMLYR